MASAVPKNRVYLFRLQTLIIDGGLLVLRHIFDHKLQLQNISFSVCLSQECATLGRLNNRNTITQSQYDLLYPATGQAPTTSDLDITLIICLLRNLKICGLNRKYNWNIAPHATDTCLEADIYRLKQYRNEIAHIATTTGINLMNFTFKWTEIEQILLRLSLSVSYPVPDLQKIINEIKTSPLDPEAEERIDKVINDWQIMEKSLEVDMQMFKSDLKKMEGRVTNIENQMTRQDKNNTVPTHDVEANPELNDDPKMKAAKKAIDKGWGKLVDYMIPDPILDCATEYDLFTFRECRDIKEEKNTTERNRSILDKIRRKEEDGYTKFKDCLHKTDQSLLVELLTKLEHDEDTKDVLEQIHDKMETSQQKVIKDEQAEKMNFFKRLWRKRRYKRKKKDLKEDLITLYRQQYHTLPLSPLIEEHDTPLLDFYVMPDINKIESKRYFDGGGEIKSMITSLNDVFYMKNKLCREIYLVANAGLGKTAFSKRLALTWCQAQKCQEEETRCFKKEEITALLQFEFVFLILLRDCSEECDIDQMIRKQILPFLSNKSDIIETVLSNEKCLVILDGLDEWVHPTSSCGYGQSEIPHRKARNCTIVTTTRPWKLSVVNLRSSQVDQKLELDGLSEMSSRKMKQSVITLLSRKGDKTIHDQIMDFDKTVTKKGVADLQTVPLLLMYLLCLWCDEIDLGRSKSITYCQIVELLLKRTLKKYPAMHSTCLPSSSDIPQCFDALKNCRDNYTFMTSLGRLAFETLFSKTRENTLVFDRSLVDQFLDPAAIELGLRSGILTQDKESSLTSERQKASFSHKTMQEFFAALYISTCSDKDKVLKEAMSSFNTVKDILEMSEVFIFISGINAVLFSSVSEKLMKVINEDIIMTSYRSVTYPTDYDKYITPVKEIQDLLISCIKEIPKNYDYTMCLQDFIFDKACREKNYYSNLQCLAVQNKHNIKSISIKNQGIRSLPEIFTACEFSDSSINCEKLFYKGECKEAELIPLLSRTVTCVTILSDKWQSNRFMGKVSSWSPKLSTIVQNNNQLQAIYIHSFTFSHDVLEEFLNYLVSRKSMKEIKLYNLYCHDDGASCPGFNFGLLQHTELRRLGLHNIPLSQLNVNVSSLEDCEIGHFYNPDIVISYLSNLSAANKIQKFKCRKLQSTHGIQTMLRTLSSLVTVKRVTLSRMNLCNCLLPHGMINIKDVFLYEVTMSSSSLRNLVSWIEHLPQQVTVELVECKITPEIEFKEIKENIQTSENFVVVFDGKLLSGKYLFEFTSIK